MLGSIARVDQHKMRTGRISDKEWSDLTEAMAKLHDTPIYIDESGALTALEVRARARRLKARVLEAWAGGDRLSAADGGIIPRREPGDRDLGNLPLAEGHGQGA